MIAKQNGNVERMIIETYHKVMYITILRHVTITERLVSTI